MLSFSLFLVSGSVRAKAAAHLINPDLSSWENVVKHTATASAFEFKCQSINPLSSNPIYCLYPSKLGDTGSDGTTPFYYAHAFDTTVLKTGNSYTFSMHILSPAEIREFTTFDDWTDSQFASNLGDGFTIGFGVINSSGELEYISAFLTLTPDNFLSLAGTDFVYSFQCPDYSGGNPCIFIMSSNLWSPSRMFFDNSMQLINNSEEDKEGLLSRLFDWFEQRFNNISSNFVNLGSKISDGFANLLKGILDGIKSLFVPSDDFILEYEAKLDKLLTERLGVIYQASDTFVTLFTSVYDLLDAPDACQQFIFPKISFDLNFGQGAKAQTYDIDLSEATTVDLSFLNDTGSFWYTFYHVYYKAILYIIMSGALLLYAYNTFDRLIR